METDGMKKELFEDYVRHGRYAFHILPELYDKDAGYQAVAAVEGLQGFYRTKLFCGHDYEMAVWYVGQKNLSMGLDTKTATKIINAAFALTAMHPWNHLPI